MEQITSAIIAAIVGFITARLTRYTDITTKSRIDWIQRVREISIEFINSIENSQNGVQAYLKAEWERVKYESIVQLN